MLVQSYLDCTKRHRVDYVLIAVNRLVARPSLRESGSWDLRRKPGRIGGISVSQNQLPSLKPVIAAQGMNEYPRLGLQ